MGERVRLRELHDGMQAQMLRDVLASEGIVAEIPGAEHRGMLGVLGSYVTIPLMVDARDEVAAREVLAALDAAPLVDEGERDGDDAPPGVSARRRRIALFVGAAFPGGAQYYLRQHWLGTVVLLGAGYSFVIASQQPGAGYAFLVFWVFGIVDGLFGVKSFNAHGPRSVPLQLLLACFVIVLAGATALAVPELGLEELDEPYYDDAYDPYARTN